MCVHAYAHTNTVRRSDPLHRFASYPVQLEKLAYLQTLDLSHNLLGSLPARLGDSGKCRGYYI